MTASTFMIASIFATAYNTAHAAPATRDGETPYGYAPYVWISTQNCNHSANKWCFGKSQTGFALTIDITKESNVCTHYCPGGIHAKWRLRENAMVTGNTMLGAYVYQLDKNSCIRIPGGFPCSDRVVSNMPINNVSIMLHATTANREYFFGSNPVTDCGSDPQCATYKLLRRTLYASPENRTWPHTDDILTIRNSQYACILSYIGFGDSDSLGSCYAQLGDNCFLNGGNRFCVGGNVHIGITNADTEASAPIAICELSSLKDYATRDVSSTPTAKEIRDFIAPSACDATVIPIQVLPESNAKLSISVDVKLFHMVSELGHVIMKIDLINITRASDTNGVSKVAKFIANSMTSTYSSALLLDASDWDNTSSTGMYNLTGIASALSTELNEFKIQKIFLRLPSSRSVLNEMDFARLDKINAFVSPKGNADMNKMGYCQNMWTTEINSEDGVVPYLLEVLRKKVRANRLIFTLALTGGIKITPLEQLPSTSNAVVVSELSLSEMETNTVLRCEEDLTTKCCTGSSVAVWARSLLVNITVTSTSFETLKRFPELIAVAFGINQFAITPVDSDFKRGIRSNTPAILGLTSAVHRLGDWKKQENAAGLTVNLNHMRTRSKRSVTSDDVVELSPFNPPTPASPQYKDPSSGSKNCLDPQYAVGMNNRIVCPGLIAVYGALGLFKEPYKEMYSTNYENIYAANVYELESCTPGTPSKKARLSERQPQIAINVNTMIATTDGKHYMLGILDSKEIVEFVPVMSKVCETYNVRDTEHNMNLIEVDDNYLVNEAPVIESDYGVIREPVEVMYFVSNFTPGMDYINLNVQCMNYDVGALKPCLIAICGGDSSCRKDYGRLCNSAHEIMNDARRAGEIMREGIRELAVQEHKARMYKMPDNAPSPWLDPPPNRNNRKKRFAGIIMGGAALTLAGYVSTRVDALESQMDELKNSFTKVTGQIVEVSKKLDMKISMVNGRIDEQERSMRKSNAMVNSNFALLRDAILRNTEAALLDTNVKFSVMASYQMWYAQMQSVTHQMMQAAMHVKFMARGVENCLRQISTKRSGSCPSGMRIIQDHPGLSDFPTVGAALYKDRKLFIVHSVPNTVEKTVVRGLIPMPNVSTDGVPCWPDYRVWLIDGQFYEPSECFGKYCYKPELHERYVRCRRNSDECKTVCAPCFRGICYNDNKITWMQGAASVEIESPPLRPFSKPHISEGPMSFADLIKNAIPGVEEISVIKAINTSVHLIDVHEDLENIARTVHEFDARYEAMSNNRVTFGGWLSGFASDAALWTSVAVLMSWCTVLSATVAYTYFCGGGSGPNVVRSGRSYKSMKRL